MIDAQLKGGTVGIVIGGLVGAVQLHLGCLAAGVLIAGAAFAARLLPSSPTLTTSPEPQAVRAPALETASTAVAAGVPGCGWERQPSSSPATVT